MQHIGEKGARRNSVQRLQTRSVWASSLLIASILPINLIPKLTAAERLKNLRVIGVEGNTCPISKGVDLKKHENGTFTLEIPDLAIQFGGKIPDTDQKLFCKIQLGLETDKSQRVRLVSIQGSVIGKLQKNNVAHVIHSQFYSKRPASAGQSHRLYGVDPIPDSIMTDFRDVWSDCGGFQTLTLGIGGLFLESENQGTEELAKITLKGPWHLTYTIEPCNHDTK